MSRLALVSALLGLLMLGGCGGDSGSAGSAKTILDRASRTPARSADVKLGLELKLDGVSQLPQPVKVSLSGPYRSNGPKKLPDLDWRTRVQAAGRNVDLRLIAVSDNAFVEYGGTTYEVGKGLVRRYRRQSQAGRQQGDIRKLGIDSSRWLKDGKVEDGGRKVSGAIDVRTMLGDVNRILAKLPRGHRLPSHTIDQIDEAVKEANIEVRVGADHILRSSRLGLRFELPSELRAKARGLRSGRLSFRYEQANVNGSQSITAPSGARPLSELLQGFGVPPGALLGPGAGYQAPG